MIPAERNNCAKNSRFPLAKSPQMFVWLRRFGRCENGQIKSVGRTYDCPKKRFTARIAVGVKLVRGSMKNTPIIFLALATTLLVMPETFAKSPSLSAFDKYQQAAQAEYDDGNYRHAEKLWERALGVVHQAKNHDSSLALVLKRLGETFLKEDKYCEAELCFTNAKNLSENMNQPDAELTNDMATLSQAYKSIDVDALGHFAEELMRDAKLDNISFLKIDSGDRVTIQLSREFVKPVKNELIKELQLSCRVRFDVFQLADGTIQIQNIHGVQIRAKHWINITEISFQPSDDGLHVANLRAKRMGFTRTATARLNSRVYSIVAAIAGQIRNRTQPVPHSIAATDRSKDRAESATPVSKDSEGAAKDEAKVETNTQFKLDSPDLSKSLSDYLKQEQPAGNTTK